MDFMKYKLLYLLISGGILAIGAFSLVRWQLNFSVDFTGGAVIEYQSKTGGSRFVERTGPKTQEEAKRDDAEIIRFENVGPAITQETIQKTGIGIILASLGILFWIAWQFKSIQFGVSAILAMLHDSFVLVGLFSLFGHFYSAQIDLLFVTALLTTLAFSVHDTIVVFDRIRETRRKFGGNLYDLANLAISQTMVRSLNNSLTIIFMLVALVLLGGSNLFWFALALLVGTVTGTYSSPFVAVPLLVTWEQLRRKLKI